MDINFFNICFAPKIYGIQIESKLITNQIKINRENFQPERTQHDLLGEELLYITCSLMEKNVTFQNYNVSKFL